MLTTASTAGQGGGHPGAGGTKVQGFPTGYLPVPTSTPGAGQTLVFGQLGVLGSPQPPPSLQQQQQQQSANKQDQVQKVNIVKTHLFHNIKACHISYIYSLKILLYIFTQSFFYISNSIQPVLPGHLLVEEAVVCSLHPGNSRHKYGLPDCNNQLCSLPRPIRYSFAVRHNRTCLYRVHNQYKRTMVSIFIIR